MFATNPVMTHKGVFRKDIKGSWWFLEKRAVPITPAGSSIPLEDAVKALHSLSSDLTNPELVQEVNKDTKRIMVIGWREVPKKEANEIEESMNSFRIIIDSPIELLNSLN